MVAAHKWKAYIVMRSSKCLVVKKNFYPTFSQCSRRLYAYFVTLCV